MAGIAGRVFFYTLFSQGLVFLMADFMPIRIYKTVICPCFRVFYNLAPSQKNLVLNSLTETARSLARYLDIKFRGRCFK